MIIIKIYHIILSFILSVLFIFSTGCEKLIYPLDSTSSNHSADNLSGRLTLNGSTSMTKLCNSLGESFMQKYPNITVEKSDTGSGASVKSVMDGTATFGDLSRKLKEEELNESLSSVTIALDGIAVIVNSKNNIDDISMQTLIDIFSKKISNWSELGGKDAPIRLIGREASSGTREGFESILESSAPPKYDAEYPETGDVVSKVGNDENAIGYCSLFSVSGNIKALKIDSVNISESTISDGSYPIQRPFIQIYNNSINNPLVPIWFDFIESDEGKELIQKEKLVPVKISFSKEW